MRDSCDDHEVRGCAEGSRLEETEETFSFDAPPSLPVNMPRARAGASDTRLSREELSFLADFLAERSAAGSEAEDGLGDEDGGDELEGILRMSMAVGGDGAAVWREAPDADRVGALPAQPPSSEESGRLLNAHSMAKRLVSVCNSSTCRLVVCGAGPSSRPSSPSSAPRLPVASTHSSPISLPTRPADIIAPMSPPDISRTPPIVPSHGGKTAVHPLRFQGLFCSGRRPPHAFSILRLLSCQPCPDALGCSSPRPISRIWTWTGGIRTHRWGAWGACCRGKSSRSSSRTDLWRVPAGEGCGGN